MTVGALPGRPAPAPADACAPEAEARYARFAPAGRGAARDLGPAEARLLDACAFPRTLRDHAAECARVVPHALLLPAHGSAHPAGRAALEAAALERLRRLAAEGVLAAEAEVLGWLGARLEAAAEAAPAPPIGALCIPTRDRPETLARGLASWLENGARHGRDTEVVVLDDSGSAEAQARNRATLRAAAARHRRPAFVATRARRAEYARLLARTAGLPGAAARFALLGDPRLDGSFGATRNALLLDGVGGLCLQVDDDTLGTVCRAPGTREELALTPGSDPNEYWFLPAFEAALAAVERVDEDFLAVHERLLGSTPGQCVASGRSGPARVGVPWDAPYLARISEPGARVAVSFGGIVGDCGGPGRNQWRLALAGPSLERLAADADSFAARLRARQLVKCPTRAAVGTGPYCMAGNMGLDLRVLLPPFVPGGVAEDALFGTLRSALFPQLLSGFVPRAVVHLPDPPRPDPAQGVPLTLYANGVLGALAGRFFAEAGPGLGAEALRALGAHLGELGRMQPDAFAARARETIARATAAAVAQLEALLAARPGAQPHWRAAVEESRRETAALPAREDASAPSDLPGSDDARRALFQRLLRGYGDVLTHWPELVEAARELRRRGVRLAEAA